MMQSADWVVTEPIEACYKGDNQGGESCLSALSSIKKDIWCLLLSSTWAKVNLPQLRGGTKRSPPLWFATVGGGRRGKLGVVNPQNWQ